jgi:hypothetical protein
MPPHLNGQRPNDNARQPNHRRPAPQWTGRMLNAHPRTEFVSRTSPENSARLFRNPHELGTRILKNATSNSMNHTNRKPNTMITKIIAIDGVYASIAAEHAGLPHFPVRAIRDIVAGGEDVDVLEMFCTVVKKVPENDTPEAVATESTRVMRFQHMLEYQGCNVLVCPDKRGPDGPKHSDDQRLMITTLSTCLRLRPDFLVFIGADGDYAPMLWELRREGIRTEVVATIKCLANDLKRVAHNVVSLDELFERIKREGHTEHTHQA